MLGPDVPRMLRSIQQTILEIQALADWLKMLPEIDPQRIGLLGYSLGSVVGALALAQTHIFSAAVFVLSGANVADTIWNRWSHSLEASSAWRLPILLLIMLRIIP